MEQAGCWLGQGERLAPTWIIAGDSRGTAEDLPQQCRVLPTVLDEDILQGLCPVELIEDDGGWGDRAEGSRLSPARPTAMTLMPKPPTSMASSTFCLPRLLFFKISLGAIQLPKEDFSCPSSSSKSSKEPLSLPLNQASMSKQG